MITFKAEGMVRECFPATACISASCLSRGDWSILPTHLDVWYEELTLKEISNILEVSESRISQLHTSALQKMRGKLGNYIGILTDTDGRK